METCSLCRNLLWKLARFNPPLQSCSWSLIHFQHWMFLKLLWWWTLCLFLLLTQLALALVKASRGGLHGLLRANTRTSIIYQGQLEAWQQVVLALPIPCLV